MFPHSITGSPSFEDEAASARAGVVAKEKMGSNRCDAARLALTQKAGIVSILRILRLRRSFVIWLLVIRTARVRGYHTLWLRKPTSMKSF